jgi:hypothetical protein
MQRLFLAFAYCARLFDLTPSFFADETAAGTDLRVLQGSCHYSSRELFS